MGQRTTRAITVPWYIPLDFSNQIMSGAEFLAKKFRYTSGVWQWVFRHSILNDVLFYDGEYWEDAEWTPRILLKATRVNTNPQLGYYYVQRKGSLVSIDDPKSIQKKIHGYQFLLEELLRQKSVAPQIVSAWYDGMIAYYTLWLLSLVAHKSPALAKDSIAFIRKRKLLPLSTYHHSPFIAKRLRIVNFSPRLYCWLVQLRQIFHV